MCRKTTEEFIKEAREIHGIDRYDYSKTIYLDKTSKVDIICNVCGDIFLQEPSSHLKGCGCKRCGRKVAGEKRKGIKIGKGSNIRKTNEIFIEQSRKIHGCEKFDYSKVEYVDSHKEVNIKCNIHNFWFEQRPTNHLRGQGCPKCGLEILKNKILLTTKDFIKICKDKFGENAFDYSETIYLNSKTDVIIICNVCKRSFIRRPETHIQGAGCTRCNIGRSSKSELEYLDFLRIPNDKDHRQVEISIFGKVYTVDGFDPITNTIYEFNGDFWHGNPKVYNLNEVNPMNYETYGDLFNKTLKKENLLKRAGYKIITMWEHDWKIFNKKERK